MAITDFRKQAWDKYLELGPPNRQKDAFQYVRFFPCEYPSLAEKPKMGSDVPKNTILFIDGFLQSANLEHPIVCKTTEEALQTYGVFLKNRLAKTLVDETDPLALLNFAQHGQSAFIYIPPKCKAALHLVQQFTNMGLASPRLHLYLGRHAELELIQSSDGKAALSNIAIDLVLDEDAKLFFQDKHQGHFQSIRAQLKKSSQLTTLFLGQNIRTSVKMQLLEENSSGKILGLAYLDQNKESHFHTTIEHIAPYTFSHQHIKSVLKDQSCFSFEGKILVRSEAQKTESYQLNNNLLLSDEAVANAKPNLEIFADDVKASHGATFGQLNEEHIFYLRSRGLHLNQAKEWLILGFCKEILDHAR